MKYAVCWLGWLVVVTLPVWVPMGILVKLGVGAGIFMAIVLAVGLFIWVSHLGWAIVRELRP